MNADATKVLENLSQEQMEGIAKNAFSEYGWIIVIGIIALLSKDLMMNFVQGVVVFLGSGFNNDDVRVFSSAEITPPNYNDRLPALQGSIKDVVTVPQCVVSLTGVSATGSTGEELVYSLIVPNQTANWQEVA